MPDKSAPMLHLRFAEPVDFAELLLDLRSAGMTGVAIAAATGSKRSTLDKYRSGARPPHARGEAIIAAWCRYTGRARDEAPRQAARNLSEAKVSRELRGPVDAFSSQSRAPAAALYDVTRAWSATLLV